MQQSFFLALFRFPHPLPFYARLLELLRLQILRGSPELVRLTGLIETEQLCDVQA